MDIVFLYGILMDALFLFILAWCAYKDWKTRAVSNLYVILLLCLGGVHTALMSQTAPNWWLYPAGLLLSIPFIVAWHIGKMGAGDAKLVAGVALYLGVLNTLVSFTLMVPALAVQMIRSWRKNMTLKNTIPFAPVLAVGAGGAVMLGYLYALLHP